MPAARKTKPAAKAAKRNRKPQPGTNGGRARPRMKTMSQAQFQSALLEALDDEGFVRYPESDDPDAQPKALKKADARDVLDVLSDAIAENLRRRDVDQVAVRGLGRYRVVKRPALPARMGRNPATGEQIQLKPKPASKALKVRPDKALAEEVL